jgi:hypothetical protein
MAGQTGFGLEVMYDVYAVAGQELTAKVAPGISDLAVGLFAPSEGAHQRRMRLLSPIKAAQSKPKA